MVRLIVPSGIVLIVLNVCCCIADLYSKPGNDKSWPVVPLAGPAINWFSMASERQESGGELPYRQILNKISLNEKERPIYRLGKDVVR